MEDFLAALMLLLHKLLSVSVAMETFSRRWHREDRIEWSCNLVILVVKQMFLFLPADVKVLTRLLATRVWRHMAQQYAANNKPHMLKLSQWTHSTDDCGMNRYDVIPSVDYAQINEFKNQTLGRYQTDIASMKSK